MKVALVHDYLIKLGGAERVLENFHQLFPEAPVYTLLYDSKGTKNKFSKWDIRPSFINKFPLSRKKVDYYRPFMPVAIEQFDFSDYDVVINSNSGFSKGIITKPETLHICYCHNPTRFLWHQTSDGDAKLNWLTRKVSPYILNYLRAWDQLAADRVDYFLGNSTAVAQRIKKYYRRDAEVLFPPVNIDRFSIGDRIGDYYLIVSRLEPHKRVDLAIAAFNDLGLPLKIIGTGSELNRLKSLASDNIEFLGEISDQEVTGYISRCIAFIYPQEEDFGITALEAQACGRPVIAYKKGGALDTIIDGKTGVLFEEQSAGCLAETVRNFNHEKFNPKEIRSHAEKFGEQVFKEKLKKVVEKYYNMRDTK